MAEQVRLGVVGTSWWADLVHLPVLTGYERAQVVAICGRTRTRAEEMASKYGIPAVFTDYRAMIAAGNLDALVIVTPDDLHYPITMAALDAQLHVLCEKPLATTAAQAREMYERAEGAGIKHMVYFSNRWLPHQRYVHQLLTEGYVGRPYHCALSQTGGYGREGTYAWRFDGRHGLGILGSHLVDLGRWYVGDIRRVAAHLGTFVERPGPEGRALESANDAAVLAVEYANGAHGTIQVSAVAHVGDWVLQQEAVIHGAAGTLEMEVTFARPEVRGARAEEQAVQTLTLPADLLQGADSQAPLFAQWVGVLSSQPVGDRLFVDAILDDVPLTPTFYDGWQTQEVLQAALHSHQTGTWATVGGRAVGHP